MVRVIQKLPSSIEGEHKVTKEHVEFQPRFYRGNKTQNFGYVDVLGERGKINRFILRVNTRGIVSVYNTEAVSQIVPEFDKEEIEGSSDAPKNKVLPAATDQRAGSK
jgi:hypothetical protein